MDKKKQPDLSAVCVAILDPEGGFATDAEIRLPASVPVLDDYDSTAIVGWARLSDDLARARVVATIELKETPGEHAFSRVPGVVLQVAEQRLFGDGRAMVTEAVVVAIGLGRSHQDPRMRALDGSAPPAPKAPPA